MTGHGSSAVGHRVQLRLLTARFSQYPSTSGAFDNECGKVLARCNFAFREISEF